LGWGSAPDPAGPLDPLAGFKVVPLLRKGREGRGKRGEIAMDGGDFDPPPVQK